jgi:ketosteroid isomerase-like protein
MSQENVEIVRREYAAFATRDWETLADLCHPDLEYETLGVAPGRLRGFREITEFFDAWAELYGEFRVEAEEIVEAGDQVVAVERHAARGVKGSEAEGMVGHSFACLISFKDGRISRVKEYATRDEALAAAGRRE